MLNREQLLRHRQCFEEAIAKKIRGIIAEISVEDFGCDRETKPS